jgi:hypothetical protein
MPKDVESEVKRVKPSPKPDPSQLRRDPSLTGGERAETPAEKTARKSRPKKPVEPPIIERYPD